MRETIDIEIQIDGLVGQVNAVALELHDLRQSVEAIRAMLAQLSDELSKQQHPTGGEPCQTKKAN